MSWTYFTFHHQVKDEKQKQKGERKEENFEELAEEVKSLSRRGKKGTVQHHGSVHG